MTDEPGGQSERTRSPGAGKPQQRASKKDQKLKQLPIDLISAGRVATTSRAVALLQDAIGSPEALQQPFGVGARQGAAYHFLRNPLRCVDVQSVALLTLAGHSGQVGHEAGHGV
jgi:hypothetical protein